MDETKGGISKYNLSHLLDEAENDKYDHEDYRSKVKSKCCLCGRICNKNKDFLYYCRFGNFCSPPCYISDINEKKKKEEINRIKKALRGKL